MPDCEEQAHGRGLCGKHYFRWQKHGDPSIVKPSPSGPRPHLRAPAVERVWASVEIGEPDECWPWVGGVDKHGYGKVMREDRGRATAHRLTYEATHGPIAPGLVIDHLCHKADCAVTGRDCPHRRCCNPSHLTATTDAGNVTRSALERNTRPCRHGHPPEHRASRADGRSYCTSCAVRWAARMKSKPDEPLAVREADTGPVVPHRLGGVA